MVSKKYTVILVACLASGWSCTAFPAEVAAVPVDAAAVPVDAAAEVAAVPTEITATPNDEQASLMRLAPVRFSVGGSVGYGMQRQNIGGSKSMSQSIYTTVNANADSFIWQPWLAKVNGGLGLNANRITNSTDNTGSKSSGAFVTGRGIMSLVPYSRFPFEARFNRSDSRQSSGLGTVSSDFKTTSFGLTQNYRNLIGDANYMVSYDHSLWEGANSSSDKQDAWRLETSHQFTDQKLAISGASNRNVRVPSNEKSLYNNLMATHNYRPNDSFVVDTLASLLSNSRQALDETSVKNKQLSSSAFWRANENKLAVNGGVRLFGYDTYSNTTTFAQSRTVNVNLGANYELSKHTRVNGSANVSQSSSSGIQSVTSSESVGASYTPDMIDLSIYSHTYSYTRSVAGSISNQNGSPIGSTQHFTLSPGHGVSRNTALGGGSLTMNLNQNLSLDKDSLYPSTSNLIHMGSLGWSLSEDQKTTLLHMSVSDSHSLGGKRDFYQLINLQASINKNLSRYDALTGNLTIQRARQGGATWSYIATSSSADLSYHHAQAFGVPRLGFASELQIVSNAIVPPQSKPVGVQVSNSWENRLEYSIGMLQSRLGLRMADVNNVRQSLLWFDLSRQF